VDRIEAAAAAIADARLSGEALEVLSDAMRPRDEADAYKVQDAVHRRLADETRYGRRIGSKIGCTTAVMQAYLGIPNPCSAGVFEGGVHKSGARLRFDDYRRVGVECEIAIRLGRDLTPAEAPFTADTIADAVAAHMAAIEIVDDRYADWRTTDTPTLIADDFFAAGCVLGPPVTAAEAPAEMVGVTVINGREAGRGRGSDVMGDPLNALAWIANSFAARGVPLRREEIVLTGSLVETKWLDRGDRVTISVSGLGAVELLVV
jgi:2-keto-4-pentenoate hydratase